jgi:hypothetical protein
MTKLNWLTLKDIYLHYLNDAETNDGTLAIEFIDKWQGELAFENSVFEMTGAQAEDRCEYERNTKPLQTLIRETEAGVFELMMKQAEIGRWIAFGRRHPDAEEEIIPSRYWAFLSLDIEKRVAKGDDMTFRGMRGLIRRQIPTGHPIHDQIRMAERRPEAAARSAEIAGADILETSATPLPDPDQMRNDAPSCPSHSTNIKMRAPRKRGKGMILVIKESKRRQQGRQQRGETAPSDLSEAEDLAKWFKKNYSDMKPVAVQTIRIWLGTADGKIAWKQQCEVPE